MAEPHVVTMTIADNPLAHLPDQTDFTITFSCEPDIDWSGELPDPETLPPAVLAAVAMLAHISDLAYETAFVQIASGRN